MSKYFYGKVTKSGDKLLINIPKDLKLDFKYRSIIKVFLLDAEEIVETEVIRDVDNIPKPMELFEAKKIIEDLDSQYEFEGKHGNEIVDYAKELIEKWAKK